ncbi:MAG: HEAT repeat domain-containing protein [Candidatus Eremiobacterota bacterium]
MDRLDKWFNRTVNFLANKVSDILDKTDIIKNAGHVAGQVKKIKKSSDTFICPGDFQAKKEFLISALSHKDYDFRAKGAKYLSQRKYFLPDILDILTISTKDREPLVRYAVAYSLGMLCSEEHIAGILESSSEARMKFPGITKEKINKVIESLKELRKDEILWVKIMAEEALRKAGHGDTIDDITEKALNKFPERLKELIEDENFIEESIEHCRKDHCLLEALYDIDSVITRKALHRLIAEIDFSKSWKSIKAIYKKAEYRMDMEMFGLLAYRIETTHSLSPVYDKKTWKRNDRFCKKTKSYMMRRCWRYLRNIAKYYPELYANFAYFFLKHFKDSDAGKIQEIVSYRYNWTERKQYTFTKTCDRFSHLWTFNHILHKKSKRYTCNNLLWKCAEDYKPSDTEPPEREEAFSELWEEDSLPAFNLFLESECREVSSFAVKILRDRFPDTLKNLTETEISDLFKKPYPFVCTTLLDIFKTYFNPLNPDKNLVKCFLNCEFEPARALAHEWVRNSLSFWKGDKKFIIDLLFSRWEENHCFAMELIALYRDNPEIISEYIKILMSVITKEEYIKGLHTVIVKGLMSDFSEELKLLSNEQIFMLLKAPSPCVQELGGNLLKERTVDPLSIDGQTLITFACHDILSIREVGMDMIKKSICRWSADMTELTELAESKWEVTREFAFNMLEEHFSVNQFTSDILLKLYDSNYKDVQEFSMKILGKYLSEGRHVEFIKFTEHPDIKEFALDLIIKNLSPEPDNIKSLMPFFRSILFNVNKGRKTKDKLFKYLGKIATNNAFIATDIMSLLEEFAGTMTERDSSDCLAIMAGIITKYPYIKSSAMSLLNPVISVPDSSG